MPYLRLLFPELSDDRLHEQNSRQQEHDHQQQALGEVIQGIEHARRQTYEREKDAKQRNAATRCPKIRIFDAMPASPLSTPAPTLFRQLATPNLPAHLLPQIKGQDRRLILRI